MFRRYQLTSILFLSPCDLDLGFPAFSKLDMPGIVKGILASNDYFGGD